MEKQGSVSKLRRQLDGAMEMGSVTSIRKHVLAGGFYSLPSSAQWRTPSFKLLVFVSSTFTDTKFERDFLMDELLFELRALASEHGKSLSLLRTIANISLIYKHSLYFLKEIEVIFADMRWGVRDENTSDHKTWIECANAIAWCKEESAGVCFLSLQGDKYGYTPLPRTILQESLEKHLNEKDVAEDANQLIRSWYILNENANPPEYTLRTLHSKEESDEYWTAFPVMLSALTGILFDTDRYPGLVVGSSVTEWEVRAAFSSYPVDVRDQSMGSVQGENDGEERFENDWALLWSYRKLQGPINNRDYADTEGDVGKQQRMSDLIAFMQNQFPEAAIKTYSPLNVADLLCSTNDNAQKPYMDEYKDFTSTSLKASLCSIIQKKKSWTKDGCGMNLPGNALAEMLHHSAWAHAKCSTFVDREALIEAVVKLVEAPHRDVDFTGKYDGIRVCVVGASGAGKTALMARVAHEIYLNQQGQRQGREVSLGVSRSACVPVLIRFCGTSTGSRNARSLMISLCIQIEYIYDVVEEEAAMKYLGLMAKPYEEVVAYFHSLLLEYPVILFIDSLDQLTDDDLGRSQISFLKGAKLHNDGRVIVSCLPDDMEDTSGNNERRYLYFCETRLKEGSVPRVDVRMSAESPVEEAMGMLDVILKHRGRRLTERQRSVVQEKVSQETEKTALYLNLAAGVVAKWSSNVEDNQELAGGVKPLILQLFSQLERDYGVMLVRAALAMITYSVRGVSNVEVEDLLSLDDEVLDFVFQYNTPTVRRLPSHVWLRLRGALFGLVVESENGCMVWYHRQLQEVAEEYFSSRKQKSHELMAVYFGNIIDVGVREARCISQQGLVLSEHSAYERAAVVNRRRCVEASKHMLACGMGTFAVYELCNMESVCCRVRVDQGFEMIADLIYYCKHFVGEAESEVYMCADHYLRWLRRSLSILEKDVLTQITFTSSAEPLPSIVRNDGLALLSLFESKAVKTDALLGYSVSSQIAFDNQLAVMACKERVESACFSPDGNLIASAEGLEINIRDAQTGRVIASLQGHDDYVDSVAFSPNGKHIVSGGSNQVRVWEVLTGRVEMELTTKCSWSCVVYSPDGNHIAAHYDDTIVCVWDAHSGDEVLRLNKNEESSLGMVEYSPNGNFIILALKGYISIWDAQTGELKASRDGYRASFSPDSKYFACILSNTSIGICETHTGKVARELEELAHCPTVVSFSPDGNYVIYALTDYIIYMWNTDSGTRVALCEGHVSHINSLSFSSDGNFIISASLDKTVRVWDARVHSCGVRQPSGGKIGCAAYSPDGKCITTGSYDSTIRVWDAHAENLSFFSQQSLWVIEREQPATCVAYSPDGTCIGFGFDKSIVIFDAHSRHQQSVLEGHTKSIRRIAYSPDSCLIASTDSDIIHVWDVHAGTIVISIESSGFGLFQCLAFSPDGNRVAAGTVNGDICLWGVSNGELVMSLSERITEDSGYCITSLAFSPDGKSIVSAQCIYLRIWNLHSGEINFKIEGHTRTIVSVVYTPDGKHILSGSEDHTFRVWDARTGSIKHILHGPDNFLLIVVSSDSSRAIVGHGNSVVVCRIGDIG